MYTYDLIMMAVLAVAVMFGLWKGLAWQIASLASLFLSYVVAFMFRDVVAQYLTAGEPWNQFLAMLILYVGTSLGIWIVFHFIAGIIDRLKLREFDGQLGALFGLAKGMAACAVVTLFAVSLSGAEQRQQIIDSHSGYFIAWGLDQLTPVIPPEWHDVVDPYLNPLQQRLAQPGAGGGTTDPPVSLPSLPSLPALPALPTFPTRTVSPAIHTAPATNPATQPTTPSTPPNPLFTWPTRQPAAPAANPISIPASSPTASPPSVTPYNPYLGPPAGLPR